MRIKISKQNSDLIDKLTNLYNFKFEGIIARIAFAVSIQQNKHFIEDNETSLGSDGKDLRDERLLFGTSGDEKPYYQIYKAVLDQHYEKLFTEEEFAKLFKKHLDFGLNKINDDLANLSIVGGAHISYLMKLVKSGLQLINSGNPFLKINRTAKEAKAYDKVVTLNIGRTEKNEAIDLRINDLKEFDSCNIAIAGMVGSGKTELVKDLMYQIARQTDGELKFIFFDYKGEGNAERLKPFLEVTKSELVDLRRSPFELNPLSFVDLEDERTKSFNIKSFVDFVCAIATQLGANQKHILQHIITEAFEQQSNLTTLLPDSYNNTYPTLNSIFEDLHSYYEAHNLKPDSLYSIISDLATNIFSSEQSLSKKIYERSLYINLPIELSDTLRQLCVFLTLKYLLAEFSSNNDTEPTDERIKPLRYVIIIDEAHVYLKNKNASKALEDILRILRSKGVVVIMLTQGVEDYKTKNFDFASQVKVPICLNVNNKDYKLIEAFVGTPRSKQKLHEAIMKLEPQKALINLWEPQVIAINQFWKTSQELNIK